MLARRQGAGKLKHIEVRLLALQDWVRAGRVRLAKCHTSENVADGCTKFVGAATLAMCRHGCGLRSPGGAETANAVQKLVALTENG